MKGFASLCALLLLAGCGFHPMYGANSVTHSPTAEAQFAHIEIPPLPDRAGQEFRNLLIDALHPLGAAGVYSYRLSISLRELDVNLGLQENATSTRGQVKMTVEYALIDSASDRVLLHETLRTSTGYNILINQFGSVLSLEDARQRGLDTLSNDLTQHLALYFIRQKS